MEKILLLPILFAVTTFISCSNKSEEQAIVFDYERADSLPSDYMREIGNIRVSIEQVSLAYNQFKKSNYSYLNSVIHQSSKATSYSTSNVKAIILGIYGADLNYTVSYQQSQEVVNYVDAIFKLSESLGIKNAFNRDIIEQLVKNDTTIDKSLLLTKAFRQAQLQLHSNDRAHLATLIAFGGWVESLYLMSSTIKSTTFSSVMIPDLFENSYTYFNVKKMLETFRQQYPDCNDMLKELEALENPIEEIISSRYQLTPRHIDNLHAPLQNLRSKLIGMA